MSTVPEEPGAPGGTPLETLLNVHRLNGKGAMGIEPFLRIAISVAAALGQLHGRGVVHKHVKPANILVNSTHDQAWLVGLGTASRLTREPQPLEPPEFAAGTLAYMAPEQTGRMNRSIDSRSDLYSLGVTFYQLLTGSLPFTASDPMEWVHCHIARKPVPPSERTADVPAPISQIIMKLLAKTAEERYQTAGGVESDLRRCLAAWERTGRIEPFAVAQHDTSDRFLIPEKLYGRESEINALLSAFDRVAASGKPELVLISGYSGIGKSSVVSEFHRSLVARGSFAPGKFDQYKSDIPYATLAQAFQSLVHQLLGKSEGELSKWRDALHDALGPNGRLIVSLIPELQLIIGEPPPIPDLPPPDAQRRFQLVLRRFIGVFTSAKHPLALFLDDLQWMDSATLDLIEDLLIRSDVRYLMLIGAYRDNEVDACHPLTATLDAIRTAGIPVQEIVLEPLTCRALEKLIMDSFHCEAECATALAGLIHEKTAGNPFFAIQFIAALVEGGLILFDHADRRWSWDLERIRSKGYTDNVAELMVAKLSHLPVETQQALQLLACMGNSTEFALLERVSQQSNASMQSELWEAIRAGLIFRTEHSYRFLHDRVREAAYSLIPENVRAQTHLRIGRLLTAHSPPEQCHEEIYEIVNHLNRGASLITSDQEREKFAELNLIAAKHAKAATAYSSALNYLAIGNALLPEDSWERCHSLVFSMELNRAECEFLTGDLATAEKRLSMLAARGANLVDKSAVACLRTTLYTTLDRAGRAVEICLEYLHAAGIFWPLHPTGEEVNKEYAHLRSQLDSQPIEALFDLPLMSDPDWRATMEVLTELSAPAFFVDANLQCLTLLRMVNISREHGNCDGSCYAYSFMNAIIGARFGDPRAGLRFGQLSLDLIEKKGLDRFQARVYFACGVAVFPWGRHVRAALPLIRRSLETALQTGDQTYAAYAYCHLVQNRLTSAVPVEEVQREAESALTFAQKTRFALAVDVVIVQLGFIKTLRDLTPRFGSLCDGTFEEDRFEQHLEDSPSLIWPACWYWLRKLQARFHAGDYRQAVAAAAKAHPLLEAMNDVFEETDYHFYAALARAAASDSATPDERREHSGALTEHHQRLALWAQNCAENFSNRVALVGAEIARLDGREPEAERLYEQAIRDAREQGFTQNEALAYELAARFYAARGFEEFADLYLRRARHCYRQWGADGKVRQLLDRYPRLSENEPAPESRGTTVEQLELATVLKVSQAVSGEMVLDRLLDKLMRAAVEHAGAERGLLIARRDDQLRIQAQATVSGADVTVNLQDCDDIEAALPQSLARYVMRTRDTVILEDASADNLFSADPYLLQHRARSIMCLPLINQGNLIGVLYLENNLAPRVFGPARIAVLKLLVSQAAMSLENTRLYRDIAEREAQFRRLVDANIVGIDIWDFDGTILEANDAFLRMVGYEREDLVSGRLRWTDLTPAQWSGRDRQEKFAEIERTGSVQPFEWEFFHKDGRRVPVLAGGASFGGTQGIGFVLDLTERKQVEAALRQSEAYLAEAQRLAHTGSWAYDHVLGKVKYYSDEAFRLFGLDPRRPGGPPQLEESLQLIHPEDRERVLQELAKIFRDNAEYEQQYRIVQPDGTVRYLHANGLPILDQAGQLLEYIGTVRDVTEREHAEQRLHAQHRVASILAEAATVEEAAPKILQSVCECLGWHVGVLWRIDREAGVLRCAELWRAPSLEALQFEAVTRTSTFRPGSGLPGRVWASGAPAYIPEVIRDPNFPRAEIAAREGLQGGFAFPILLGQEVLGVIECFSRDVWQRDDDLLVVMATIGSQIGQFTRRAAAVDELQLRVSMLQHIPVAAWSVMPDGTPDIVNQLWYEYTGRKPEYMKSHHEAWVASLHPEDRDRATGIYWDGIRSGRGFTMEARILRARDGTYRWHLNRAVAVRDSEGNILRFVGTSTDVHDWRQAQEELRNMQAELAHTTRVLTMGELTASIAHEVNQPLGAIVTSAGACARWLAAKPPQMEKARRALERIASDGRRAGEVIKRIRALMKRQAPQKEWLEINEAIREVIAIAQHQLRRNNILLEIHLAPDLPLVRGDRVQLQQVLLNLIVNAIEAMSGVDARRRELTIVSVTDGPDAVAVEVRDSGMGVTPERAANLFEPFYTTKAEGLGIGLSISRSIVESHGGQLSAAANAPHGAVFRFSVPLEEPVS